MSNPTFSDSNFVAGYGDFANDPTKTGISDRGPLPIGTYYVGAKRSGSSRRSLTPDPLNNMFGRFAFQTHGCGNPKTCSNGCIAAKDLSTTSLLNYIFGLEEGNNTIYVTE